MAAELGNAVVSGVASKVAELLFDPIRRELSYVFKYQSYVHQLRSQLVDLKNKRQRLEQTVKDAEREGREIYDDVQKLRDQMTEFIERADKLVNEDEDVAKNKRCFKGLCPNLMSRRKLSKEAVNAGNVVNDLLRKNFTNVSYLPAPERTESMNDVRGYQQFDSQMKIFQDVMEVLKDDKVGMIGVYGMGGVGKTTLVKQVAKKVMEEKLLFDEVATVEVTLNPDLKTIQDKIAYDIGFSFPQHESALYARANRLRQRLKEKKVLVILDNIWAKLDLEAVGIPSGVHDHRQCTILLTSRLQHVLCNDMNSQMTFSIEVLSNEESMEFFWKTVGDDFAQTSDFRPLAVEIVRKCEGLPVAIKTIANALKNNDLRIWRNTLNQLRNSNPKDIYGMEKKVYSPIKVSYDLLENKEAKSLFRLCALQKDGSQIPVNDLMIYGMGLGWFTNVYSLKDGRDRVHALIRNLKTSSLLLDGNNEHVVKMHDVIHDVAVSIAAEELMFNIQNVDALKGELENVIQKDSTAISLPYRNIQELPERLECPKLKLFLLFGKFELDENFELVENSLQISDFFFEGMKELRVLHLTSILFSSISSSLGCLINLHTLSLNYFNSLEDVAIIGKLTKLQILSFRGSEIGRLPLEIGQLTRLKLLDLSDCRSLVVIAPNVISKLSRLEELYMGNSFTHWEKGEGGSNASLDELKALSKLTTLDLHIPNVRVMPQDLVAVELERYNICIGDSWWNWWDLKSLATYERMLKLRGLDKRVFLGSGMKKLLKNIEYLHLNGLVGFQNVVNELPDREDFQQLKHLHVENDSEILYIVNSVGQIAFPLLESLFLRNLTNLEKVCQSQLTEDRSFSKLRIIDVAECHGLEHLFSFSMAQNCFRLIREIEVTNCKNLKMIVGEESENHIVRENERINFSQLQSLKLGDLPNLTSLGFDREISRTLSATPSASKEIVAEDDREDFMTVLFSNKVIFPALEKLVLCSINMEKIWPDPFPTMSTSPSQNLTELTVVKCSRLKFLFTYSMANSLVRLQKLSIVSCNSMERVIDTTGLRRDEEQMINSEVFPKLEYLDLSGLPKLARFVSMSSSNLEENNILHTGTQSAFFNEKVRLPSLEKLSIEKMENMEKIWLDPFPTMSTYPCQNLTELTVKKCSLLKFLFTYSMVNSLVKLQKLEIQWCKSMERVIDTTGLGRDEEQMINSEVFPKLKYLDLFHLPKLARFMSTRSSNSECTQSAFFNEKIRLPSLEKLSINWMENLRKIWQWHPQLAWDSFSKLKELEVCGCNELTSVFSSNIIMGRKFERLEVLKVIYCNSIEEIIEEETSSNSSGGSFDVINRVFSGLLKLQLEDLQKLKNIYQGKHILEWPVLKDLYVKGCHKVEMLFASSELLESQQPIILVDHRKVAFPNLKTLKVEECDGLRNLVTLSTTESQVKLARMKISNCKMMEKIIEMQVREGVKEDTIVFSQLEYLELDNLPTLESFCLENYTLKFPYLEQVIVSACPNMKIFSQGVLDTPMLYKVQLINVEPWEEEKGKKREERWEGNLNSTIRKMSQGMDQLCGIKDLKLSKFPSLKEIWDGPALPVSFFSNLTTLVMDDCPFMLSAIPSNLVRLLNNLSNLEVRNCDSVEEVFHLEDLNADKVEVFPNLFTLKLVEEVFHLEDLNADKVEVFPNLFTLKLVDLPKLKRFCNYTENIINLSRLNTVWIENCPNVETFISNSTPAHMTTNREPQEKTSEENFLTDIQPFFNEKVAFRHFYILKLFKLPKLLHLWKENSHPSNVFKDIGVLEISECHNLRQLVPSSITFEYLMVLEVSKCDGLINLAALSTAKSLANLTRMKVNDCKMIEEIIQQQVGEEAEKDCIVFGKLQYLELSCLPSLTSFCLGNYTLEFPSLEHVFVEECPKMDIFSWGVLRTSILLRQA